MKTFFKLIGMLLLIPFWGTAQIVDGVEIDKDSSVQYVKVRMVMASNSGPLLLKGFFDTGYVPAGKPTFSVLDKSGNPRLWKTQMDLANYLYGFGWDLLYEAPGMEFVFKKRH